EVLQALIRDMLAIYERCGREVWYFPHEDKLEKKKYWPRRYQQKLKASIKLGAVFQYAEFLVQTTSPSRGFLILKDADKLGFTVEALVADESRPYHPYFTQPALDAARAKLTEHAGQPSVPALPAPSDEPGSGGEHSAMLTLRPGDSLYVRVEVGPSG